MKRIVRRFPGVFAMVCPTLLRRRMFAAAVVAFALAAVPAQAAHRARLSADLEDHLAAGSQAIDLIVHGTPVEIDALAARYNLRVRRYLKSGAVFRVNAGQLAALQQDEAVDHLSSDILIRSAADVTAEAIGADQVWAGSDKLRPLSGEGIGVAVIDSGVDPSHAALRNRVVVSVDFTGGDGVDRFGHGTHVAAIIAGRSGRTSDTREYRGIASGAHIINLRVLGDDGSGQASSVIEAIDWAIENRQAYNIRVVNLSLGAPVLQPYRDDPLCEAVERAVAAGLIVVASAGNHGQIQDGRIVYGGITSPGNDPNVITVGALDTHDTAVRSDDTVAKFSSRGPTRFDLVLKPDLVAPGSRVVSAEAAGSHLASTYPQRHVTGVGADAYMQLSGTSMAAGVVSGTVALLLEEKPKLSARDMKAVLQLTSSFMQAEGLIASGAGSLNVIAAVAFTAARRISSSVVTTIAGEWVGLGGILTSGMASEIIHDHAIVWGNSLIWGNSIVWGSSIVWGKSSDSIVWGNGIAPGNSADSIVWGNSTLPGLTPDPIVWGDSTGWVSSIPDDDSIVWGNSDSVIRGNGAVSDSFWVTATPTALD
jgi:serine protease AprX